ncbi:cytochrome c3 family protein [Neobacillus sp. NPDC097160]|uniref:cytochrome c3 family protein n=1 Tax=Neobacillus sp. NPDC097160 TaxID=3364298 RepID=UPI0037F55C6A
MKRMNYKRKLISYVVIWSVFIGSLLSYSPDNIALSASGVPEIKILTPDLGAVFNVSTVEFTGRISDDLTTPDKLPVKVFDTLGDSQQPIDITGEGKLSITLEDKYADFSYSRDFSEGAHTLTFVVTDEDGVSNKVDQAFTVTLTGKEEVNGTSPATVNEAVTNPEKSSVEELGTSQPSAEATVASLPVDDVTGKRPYMFKMFLIPKDAEDKYVPGNTVPSTYLPAEDMTRVPLGYQILIEVRSTQLLTKTQPLITFFGDITGTEKLVKTTKISDEINAYVYSFTPDKQFNPGTTYSVYLNPKFSNDLGNEIIPRFLKFTTVSGNYENYEFPAGKGNDVRDKDYIHGPFSNVTNACSFCHSTHNGKTPTLEGGKYGAKANNLCMACHDGTNGSPKLESNMDNNKHYKDSSVSCTSCHNPHTPGTKENPNSFHSIESPDSNGSHYKAYNKASTAKGNADDFSLCLSCHNGIRDETGKETSNIKKYYTDETLLVQSVHNLQATEDSGSKLNGQLPCAECHETHGSDNLFNLRRELGNKPALPTENQYKTIGTTWNEKNERNFCLNCHNVGAEIYGKKAVIDNTISGHQDDSKACSECHSDQTKTYKSFREKSMSAAHAPFRGVAPSTNP